MKGWFQGGNRGLAGKEPREVHEGRRQCWGRGSGRVPGRRQCFQRGVPRKEVVLGGVLNWRQCLLGGVFQEGGGALVRVGGSQEGGYASGVGGGPRKEVVLW